MPHIVVEYSRDLEKNLDVPNLLKELHLDLVSRDTIAREHVKTYALPIDLCEVGFDETPNSMLHVILKLLPGRSVDLKTEMVTGLRSIVDKYVSDISVTVEVQELEAETYSK